MCELEYHYCEGCKILTDALRDMELQCREAEDERTQQASAHSRKSGSQLDYDEETFLTKLAKLERRRDFALEVLLRHQSLEHRS
jgi:hypothetical protein